MNAIKTVGLRKVFKTGFAKKNEALKGLDLEILEVDQKRIKKLRIKKADPEK